MQMMKKAPLYSRSHSAARPIGAVPEGDDAPGQPVAEAAIGAAAPAEPRARWRRWAGRHERGLWAFALLAVVGAGAAYNVLQKAPPVPMTMEQIDHAMRKSIAEKPLASAASNAYQAILPSVVRVVGLLDDKDDGSDTPTNGKMERGVGSGVVIQENGTILTNLHVVASAKHIKVTFYDGLDSDAELVSVRPEHDLAVLRAKRLPDDLQPATMRSTGDLRPGDEVVAVGFPFGIGPSVSSGVVSGLKREFRSPEGEQTLTNLIQFDAAANPGNSGGPLVTMDGEVVGIVTAILNPSHQRVFIGIGFAVPIENAAAAAGMPPF
jgi:S1-C subfamily serine protease